MHHIFLDPPRQANERENNRNVRHEKESIYYDSPSIIKDLIFNSKGPQIKPEKQLQKMNNSTFQCTAGISFGKQYLTDTHVVILVSTYVALLLGNIIFNSLEIYLLLNTRQLSNYSSKFTMLLFSSDVVTDCIFCSNTSNIDIAPATRPIMFSLSFNTVLFNNIYKDFSIYYRPNRTRSLCSDKVHNELYTLTAIRAHILMASVCVINVINVSVNTIGAYYNNRSLLRGVTAFFDVLVFIFAVALQIRTVIIMKRRVAETENSEVLNQSIAKIIKLSLHMMLLFMVCTIPFNMISFIRFLLVNHLQGYSRSHIEFFKD